MREWEWDPPAHSGSSEGSRYPPVVGRPGGTVSGPAESPADTPTSGRGSAREREQQPVRGWGLG